MFDKQFKYNEITNTWTVNLKPRYDHALPDDDEMDEDNNPIIKNTGDINIDTTTYFQQETQNITQNGDYIYEQNENGAWHLELKPQDSTEPTDVNINISSTPIYPTITSPIENNGYYKFNGNTLITGTDQDYNINVEVNNRVIINKITTGVNNNDISSTNNGWTYYRNSTEYNIYTGYINFVIYKNNTNNTYEFIFVNQAYASFPIYVNGNSWVYNKSGNSDIIKFWKDNQMICYLQENNNDSYQYNLVLSQELINFNGISWMTFN